MGSPHRYSEETRAAWWEWYTASHGRTAQQTAEHFGVPVASVRRHLWAMGRITKPYAVDPFGAAAGDIMAAVDRAMANDGAMSQGEYDILVAVRKLVA